MKPTPQRLAEVAWSWEGTPFCQRAAFKGTGVCCHKLMAEILKEAWETEIEVPDGDAQGGKFRPKSEMEAWLEGNERFEKLPGNPKRRTEYEPGDILLVRTGVSPNHMVMILPDDQMVHVTTAGVVNGGVNRRFLPLVRSAWRFRG